MPPIAIVVGEPVDAAITALTMLRHDVPPGGGAVPGATPDGDAGGFDKGFEEG